LEVIAMTSNAKVIPITNQTQIRDAAKEKIDQERSKFGNLQVISGGQSSAFPAKIMNGVAGDFAKLFASYLESPEQFFFFSFLTCLGSMLADRLTINSQIEPQPRLFTLILGESADDRKSTAIAQTTKFFRETFTDAFCTCYGTGSAEGLQQKMKRNNKLLLIYDEFRQFVSKCKIESSVLLPCVTTLFESNHYESQTKNHSLVLDNAYLSLIAASTVQTYETMWSSAFIDIGFTNRLFLVTGSGKRRFAIPDQIPDNAILRLKQDVVDIARNVSTIHRLEVESAAKEHFEKWYLALEQSLHAKRLDGFALRLMPLLAINAGKTSIDKTTAENATALCDWQLEIRKAHDPLDCDNKLAEAEQKIRRALRSRGPLRERDLKRACNANRMGIWIFNRAKENLLQAKEIGFDKKSSEYVLIA
jgi:hypothetical protein